MKTFKNVLWGSLFTMAIGAFAACGSSSNGTAYKATLTGAMEAPMATNSTAMGMGTFTLDSDGKTFHWNITHNVANATAWHFHNNVAGMAGPVMTELAKFYGSPASPITGSSTVSPSFVTALSGQAIYVNIHSQMFAGGEIRGQITP